MAENSYEIYQLKNDESTRDFAFEGTEYLKKKGLKVERGNYDLVYHAPLDDKETLDSIYMKFNLYHPADFRGHSLSVSDIVVFHKDDVDTAYYVDSFGFAEVPEFLQVKSMEQLVTMQSTNISVTQHFGTWHPVEKQEIDGRDYFLLEHDTYGRDVASVIVDEKGTLYAQDVFDGFSPDIVDLIRTASAPVSVMPDPAVSVEDMEEYGYHYPGMVPMGAEAATEYFKQGSMMIYALHPDGTETVIGNEKQLQRHIENGGLFGVDKPEWMKYLENGEYLRSAEMADEQNYNMIDGRNNNSRAEKSGKDKVRPQKESAGREDGGAKASLIGRLKEKQDMLSKAAGKDAPGLVKKPEMDMQ
ncbi:MAG: YodL domain-containing protein [Lachnospiraceae bacterium]|nr:YodL domain-containing protein [Lachnospiraceae bacterium]